MGTSKRRKRGMFSIVFSKAASEHWGPGVYAMKTVDIGAAKKSLGHYTQKLNGHSVVVTQNRKPVAALVPLLEGEDLESFSLSINPRFLNMLDDSRASIKRNGGVSPEELRRQLGLPARRTAKPKGRPRPSK